MLWAAVPGILPPSCPQRPADHLSYSVFLVFNKGVSCVCSCLWHSNAPGACLHPSLILVCCMLGFLLFSLGKATVKSDFFHLLLFSSIGLAWFCFC